MERGRTQSASAPEVQDPGEEPDEGDGSGPVRGNVTNSGSSNTLNNNNLPFPPSYPCNEVCAHCGKKIADVIINDEVQQEPTETLVDCPCECHRQANAQPQKPTTPQMHIPPGGPNCLPGCGYSGLPCYNCSSFQNHLQPQEPTTRHISQGQGFPTQIYTVELMNPASPNGFRSRGSPSPDHRILVQSEDSPEASKRRKTCISLVIFVITINIAIAIFRMLSGGSMFSG